MDATKRCRRCDVVKSTGEFYRRYATCKACVRKAQRERLLRDEAARAGARAAKARYKATPKGQASERRYATSAAGKAARSRKYLHSKARLIEKQERYRATPQGRETLQRYNRSAKGLAVQAERRARDADKVAARNALNHAIRRGEITRQPCERCGSTSRVQGHHADYAKPLAVTWMCHRCHVKAHMAKEAAAS